MQQGFCRVGMLAGMRGTAIILAILDIIISLVALINIWFSHRMETTDREQPPALWSPGGLIKKCCFRFQLLTDRAAQSRFLYVPS